ncbi:MAG: DNA photolyase family protein [Candidatus Dependentiae bacterium]|nr:DNA photolyase family protein [Candidatus Dependentiae bacterium]
MKYKKALFIFRRDLRLHDNTGLIEATKHAAMVIPCFIFDSRQIGPDNRYKSDTCIQFMIESLHDLDKELKIHKTHLYIFNGEAEKVIEALLHDQSIDAVLCNRDYTPFSIKRDTALKKICEKNNVAFHQYADVLLHDTEEIRTKNGTPYLMFTPFFKYAHTNLTVRKPKMRTNIVFYGGKIHNAISLSAIEKPKNDSIAVRGGRANGLKLLKKIDRYRDYEKMRDFPAIDATTHLSAHNKFGTVSIREVYYAVQKRLGSSHALLRELYWRDFFTHIAFHFPHVFGQPFKKQYDELVWENNKKKFKAWCEGKTGFPIVDAGMRELNATGYMHNRVRMITASFLVKDLHIDWRWGERYFAQTLVDYDPSVNNGNWQWVASTGCDAQPYFRIFNPWLQQKKFDAECLYIKKWISELKAQPPAIIHTWFKKAGAISSEYPVPIVQHDVEAVVSKTIYSKV